jgi:DnaJ-class molecular chaperone
MSNYYDILGVDKNASIDDIKKAYRKLAIQHHPDKGGDEKKFQEISAAYDVLNDEKKKKEYDNGGNQRGRQQNHEDIFAQMFGNRMNGRNHNEKKEYVCSDINRNYKISLKDAFTGSVKNLKIRLKAYNFDKIKECDECNGLGKIRNIQNMGIFTQVFECACNKCKTTGFIEIDNATYDDEKNIQLIIPKGIKNGNKIVLNGCGEQSKLKNIKAGNLIFTIEIENNNSINRDGDNLHYKFDISFIKSIVGEEISYNLFDEEKIEFNTKMFNIVHPNKKYEILNKGMYIMNSDNKRGSFIIEFNINYPQLNDEKRNNLEKILKDILN